MAELGQEPRKQETYAHHYRTCIFLAVVRERSRVSRLFRLEVNNGTIRLNTNPFRSQILLYVDGSVHDEIFGADFLFQT